MVSNEMDDLGVPLFLETPIYSNLDDEWVPGSQLTPRSETKTKTNRDYMTLAEMSIPSSSHSYNKHITFTIHPPPHRFHPSFGTPLPPKKTPAVFVRHTNPSDQGSSTTLQSWWTLTRSNGPSSAGLDPGFKVHGTVWDALGFFSYPP